MTGHVLDDQPDYCSSDYHISPHSRNLEDMNITPDQLDTMKDVNDKTLSQLLLAGESEQLVGQLEFITTSYLLPREQGLLFSQLCILYQIKYSQKQKQFNKEDKYNIYYCLREAITQKTFIETQYRKYTDLRARIKNILHVIKPDTYAKQKPSKRAERKNITATATKVQKVRKRRRRGQLSEQQP
jgi:hypothetical protein